MSKVKIKTTLINEKTYIYETKGIKQDNYLRYLENNMKVEIKIEKESIKIKRTIEKISKIEMTWKEHTKTSCLYHLLEYNQILNLSIWTQKIIKQPNCIIIDYKIEEQNQQNQLKIEYEVEK